MGLFHVFHETEMLESTCNLGISLHRPGDLQQFGLAEVGGEDLQADGQVVAAVEAGGAAGHGDARDAGEVGGERENIR